MKSSLLLSLYTAAFVTAVAHPKDPQIVLQEPQPTIVEPDEYLIELSPGETRWVTEDDKWALRRVCSYHTRLSGEIVNTMIAKHQLL